MRLRFARSTNHLRPLERFSVEGAGLEVRSRFAGHQGFSGLILAGEGWELEFVVEAGHAAPPGGRILSQRAGVRAPIGRGGSRCGVERIFV